MSVYKPIFSKPEEEMQRRIDQKVKSEVDERIKSEVDERVTIILKQRDDADKKDRADRMAKAVDTAKNIKAETINDKEKVEKEKAEKDLLCPTCHAGHVHKAETDKTGMVYVCNEKGCGFEAILVPKNSDYKCLGCGVPIKRPEKEEHAKEMDGCPFCRSKRAARFEWSKLWAAKK